MKYKAWSYYLQLLPTYSTSHVIVAVACSMVIFFPFSTLLGKLPLPPILTGPPVVAPIKKVGIHDYLRFLLPELIRRREFIRSQTQSGLDGRGLVFLAVDGTP